jgi:DNA-binding response OmpR family regulator
MKPPFHYNPPRQTVLIIDDEPSTRRVLEHFLKREFDVVVKEDGLTGMGWLDAGNAVDLIIADLNMPHLNGREFIRVLRASNLFGDLPLVMLSGTEESSDRIQCLELGADDFMVKPFNPMEVMAKIKAILRRVQRV